MSVAFTKEESAETASETLLPDRPISSHPNLVTENGLALLRQQLVDAKIGHDAAQQISDANERRRASANSFRDARYFAERIRTAQVVPGSKSVETVTFGSIVRFKRNGTDIQTYRIVGEDEADPKAGSISYVSPVARLLLNKAVGDVVEMGAHQLKIIAISK